MQALPLFSVSGRPPAALSPRVRALLSASALVCSFLVGAVTSAQASPLSSLAASLSQLNFVDESNGLVADFSVDFTQAGGIGYVNVVDDVSGEWLVRNMPVNQAITGGISSLTTYMDLGYTGAASGTAITSTSLVVDFSPFVLTSAGAVVASSGGVSQTLTLGSLDKRFGGGGNGGIASEVRKAVRPDLLGVNFNLAGRNGGSFQLGHDNIQAAHNQCAPAAIANSLSFIEVTKNVPIAQNNVLGFSTDGSLVGTLEISMGRPLGVNRADTAGGGVWPMKGTLDYIDVEDLENALNVRHRVGGGSDNVGTALSGGANFSSSGVTSLGEGAGFDLDWLINKLSNGSAVSGDLSYVATNGKHYVQFVGGGYIADKGFVVHLSDEVQASAVNGDTLGTTNFFGVPLYRFEYLNGARATGSNADIDQLIAINAAAPEPATAALALVGMIGVSGRMVVRRRAKSA